MGLAVLEAVADMNWSLRFALGIITAIAGYVAAAARLVDGDVSLGCAWLSLSSLWVVVAIEFWGAPR